MGFSYVSQGTLAGAACILVCVLVDIFTELPYQLIYIVGPLLLIMVPYFIYDKVLKVTDQPKSHFGMGLGLAYAMFALFYFVSVMGWQNW